MGTQSCSIADLQIFWICKLCKGQIFTQAGYWSDSDCNVKLIANSIGSPDFVASFDFSAKPSAVYRELDYA